jgi:hypothetical protein
MRAAIRNVEQILENIQVMMMSSSRGRHPKCRYDTGISDAWGLLPASRRGEAAFHRLRQAVVLGFV